MKARAGMRTQPDTAPESWGVALVTNSRRCLDATLEWLG